MNVSNLDENYSSKGTSQYIDHQKIVFPAQDKGAEGYQGTHWALLALQRHGEAQPAM